MANAPFFGDNPLIPNKREKMDLSSLLPLLVANSQDGLTTCALVLPFFEGRPLVCSRKSDLGLVEWDLAWQPLESVGLPHPSNVLPLFDQNVTQHFHGYEHLMYLGDWRDIPRFALDFTPILKSKISAEKPTDEAPANPVTCSTSRDPENLFVVPTHLSDIVNQTSASKSDKPLAFVDLRVMMVATDCRDNSAIQNLAIAGQSRALLEWHKHVQYCGKCGSKTVPIDLGFRRLCQKPSCGFKMYPRLDPVVIMLIIDQQRDRVVLGRQSRFQPGMWSCIAGFIEAGETLEEAVRRETMEEIGLEIDKIVYQTSQPWPVGLGNMSCQLMIGFFAFAKTFDITVNTNELQDARWYTRHEVKQVLSNEKDQADRANSLEKLHAACHSIQPGDSGLKKNTRVGMYVPGPYAIAHHLIKSWAGSDLISRV